MKSNKKLLVPKPKIALVNVMLPPVIPSAEAANFFHVTRVNGACELLVGTLSLTRAEEAIKRGDDPIKTTAHISHVFLFSAQGFDNLVRAVDRVRETSPDQKTK